MRKQRDLVEQRPAAALIVTCGSADLKCRPLDRDILVLGRAPGCDLRLLSPEVAPTHCVIVRVAGGWRVRDCSGRSGTWVNGKSVRDEALRDGDTLQVGTFSFQAQLPRGGVAGPAVGPPQERQEEAGLHARLPPAVPAPAPEAGAEEARRLDLRGQELGHYARHLRRLRQRLAEEGRPATSLRQEIRERDALIDQLQARLGQQQAPDPAEDAAQFEAELNRAWLELERDRGQLNEQIDQMKRHHAEREQAAREAELQMARERALIAQERVQLQRLREEVRQERERSRRDNSLRQRLAAVKHLKEELVESGRAEAGTEEPGHRGRGPRWRSLLARLDDTTT
jgi:hypothetical protein